MKAILLLVVLFGCSGKQQLMKIQGETMGTYYKVTTYGTDSSVDLKKDVDKFLSLFNDIFSTYEEDSEISKINKSKFNKIKISDSMRKALELSLKISRDSLGYFDITVAPLVNLWGFGPEGKRMKPTDEQVAAVKKFVGFNTLKFENDFLVRESKKTILDMSAVAKGFGVDELVKFLEYRGYSKLLVEIGGEVRSRGKKEDGRAWRVGIEGPSPKLGGKLVKVVPLTNMSMASSGSYRNFVKYGEEIFSHTINPKTGYPAKNSTISVSVISEYCADADAWATAFMGMPHTAAIELANRLDIRALFQVKENDKVEVLTSTAFEKYINR